MFLDVFLSSSLFLVPVVLEFGIRFNQWNLLQILHKTHRLIASVIRLMAISAKRYDVILSIWIEGIVSRGVLDRNDVMQLKLKDLSR